MRIWAQTAENPNRAKAMDFAPSSWLSRTSPAIRKRPLGGAMHGESKAKAHDEIFPAG
jgi:hypothetical protein